MGNSVARMIIGQRPGGIDGPVELLRRPSLIQGVQQGQLQFPSMANGTVAYRDSVSGTNGTTRVWVGDQIIAEYGQPVPGIKGWSWSSFSQVELTTSGSAFVLGYAENAAGDWRHVVWQWPAGQVLLATGNPLAGFTRRIDRFASEIEVSPDGSQWSVVAKERVTGREAIVVDGAMIDLGGGRLAMEEQPLPNTLLSGVTPANWETIFGAAKLNNSGDYACEASYREVTGGYDDLRVRNGRRFGGGGGQTGLVGLVGLDARGAALVKDYQGTSFLTLENYPVVSNSVAVDVDGQRALPGAFARCSLIAASRPSGSKPKGPGPHRNRTSALGPTR
jgi:hypothetical protein